jgi:two-component system, OmpR family, response regulator
MINLLQVESGEIEVGALHVDLEGYRADFEGRSLALSRSQFELLAILLVHRQRVVSRAELSEALGLSRGRSVDVLLSGLRRQIGRDFVRNVRNRGWIVEAGSLEP